MTFQIIEMPVTSLNKDTKKREPVGEVEIYVPTLADTGLTGYVQAVGEDKKPLFTDEGIPVYEKDEHNFIQEAITSAVKAQARNRFAPGTVTLKGNLGVSKTWEDLTAENVGANNGQALAKLREVKALFSAFITSLGKSPSAKERILALFNSKEALRSQDGTNKEKMQGYVEEFAASLTAEQIEKYERPIQIVLDNCASNTEADDF